MGRDGTPSWLDPSDEPEDNNQSSLPPWLREDKAEAQPPPEQPAQNDDAAALPPWLRQPDDERDMLKGEQLSDEWLSNADALADSVETEVTYDEWLAMQQERARPKSIEEEVPDLLSDLPPEPGNDAPPQGVTGELPDWFLGLEELDTSDAPDWFVENAEEPAPTPTPAEEPPGWINDLEQAQTPQLSDDTIGNFFNALNRSSTLPSGESMDDLFGEFAMSPAPDEELPDLESAVDWESSQPQAASSAETSTDEALTDAHYGASEMDDFFRSLSQSAGTAPTPQPPSFEEELPDSSALLSHLSTADEPDEPLALPDIDPFALDDLPEPAQAAGDIEEPDLEWFIEQPAAPPTTAPLSRMDSQPDIPEPSDEELNAPETLSWLNELEGIVSSVTHEEDEALPTVDDFFPVEPEPETAEQAQNTVGRGDDFDWPEPEPYVEQETPQEEEQPQNWFDQFNLPNIEPEEQADARTTPPPSTRLTGMLNRIRAAEEASVPDIQPQEPTPEDDLDSLFLTEELLAEAASTQTAETAPEFEDLFASSAENADAAPASDWGSTELDDIFNETPAGTQPETRAEDDLAEYGFDSIFDSAPAEQPPSASDAPDFEIEPDDQTPAQAETPGLTGLLSHVHLASLDESQPDDDAVSDLFGSDTEDVLFPAEWDPEPEQPQATETPEEAIDFGTADEASTAEEAYEPQWGTADAADQQDEAEDAIDFGSFGTADEASTAEEAYEPQWGTADQQDEAEDAIDFGSFGTADETPTAEEAYEPQWGTADAADQQDEAEDAIDFGSFGTADETPASEEAYEPQWGTADAADEQEDDQEWAADLQPELSDLIGAGEAEAPDDAEDFADMDWLTDDIFAETGSIPPAAEQPAGEMADIPETDDGGEFAAAAPAGQWNESAFETEAQAEAAAEAAPEFDLDEAVLWDAEEDAQPASAVEPATDDFLKDLRREQPVSEAEADDDFGILWGADEDEAEAVPAEDDFLRMLQPEIPSEPAAPAEAAGFDDDFLASLDTLDQVQASGQSHVGDDLFSTLLEEQPEDAEPIEAAGEDALPDLEIGEPEAAFDLPDDDDNLDWLTTDLDDEDEAEPADEAFTFGVEAEPQAELNDDFFASLEAASETDEENAEDEPDLFTGAQPEAISSAFEEPELEEPEFGDDFFAALDEGAAANDAPDLFTAFGNTGDSADELPPEDDFFRDMGLSETTPASEAQPAEDADWLSDLGVGMPNAQETEDDPFRTFDSPAPAAEDEPAWLRALNKPVSEGDEDEASVDDWFNEYAAQDDGLDEEDDLPEVGPIEDLDSYLASLSGKEAALRPSTKELLAQEEFDIDAMFEEPLIDEDSPPAPAQTTQPFIDAPAPDETPEWLTDVAVGEVSAGAIVRQRKDRPEGELDDRLKKLRRKASKVPAASAAPVADDSLAGVLPDVEDTLAPANIRTSTPSLIGGVSLSSEQQQRVSLLKTLVSSAIEDDPAPKRLSAIDMTYDDAPYQLDLEEDRTSVVQPETQTPGAPARAKSARRTRTRPRIRLGRLLITLLLAGGVLGPFLLPGLRVGNLPPSAFVGGSAQNEAFRQLDRIAPGTLVLFAVEYSPAAAAELDPMTDALLRHVLMQNAYPVIISGNPLALLRAGNLLDSINADEAFLSSMGVTRGLQPNSDYYVVNYIPGSTIGLRAFSADSARMLLADVRGQATGLDVRSLRDFPVIVVISDRAEDVRSYAEQVAPLADATVIAAVSYSAAPLVEPYVNAEILGAPASLRGLLVGYEDAYTYNTLIDSVSPVRRSVRRAEPVIRTTPEPTPMPAATDMPLFTPTPSALGSAVVTAGQTVNVRPQPNTNNQPIGQLRPGDEVEVLGYNDDRSWINIRLTDGREGWISAALVDVEEAPQPKRNNKPTAADDDLAGGAGATCEPAVRHVQSEGLPAPPQSKTARKSIGLASPILQDNDAAEDVTAEATADETEEAAPTRRPTRTPRPTAEPEAEATPEVTAEATADAGQFTLPPHSPGYRDERWYAMTMGIIVSVVVISLGTVINIVRSFLRRRR